VFRELLQPCGVKDAEAAVLEAHYELLCRWNKVINLTGIGALKEAVLRHYCEALFLSSRLPEGVASVGDIGSGAGFPGFPLAVVRPGCMVTLIEADQRKAVFLREASRGVRNIRVLAMRAEVVKERFEWALSRAVSYTELGRGGWKLGDRLALLTGGDSPPDEWGLSWESIPVPGSRQRFLRMSSPRSST
jgi:16S rRNA (guanine527-N7)-methyltransferase